jgi:hypothetical protein
MLKISRGETCDDACNLAALRSFVRRSATQEKP